MYRVESRQGGADRGTGRMAAGVSLDVVAANLGKRSVALNLDELTDRARFDALVASSDILIENNRLGSETAAMLDVAFPFLE